MTTELVCEWCGATFNHTRTRRGGTVPRYCRRSHRQRAYEARKTAEATASVTVTKGSRKRKADPLGMLAEVDRLVMIISQARDERRPAIEGLTAMRALTKALADHQLYLIIGAERAGANDKTIGKALDMTAAEVDAWRLKQLHLTDDE